MMEALETAIRVFALAGLVLYVIVVCSLWSHPKK